MLSLALPKGSLEEQTLLLFSQADLEVKKSSREYNPTIDDPRIDKVKILRPQEIPMFVQDGYFDLGISGHDWVTETGADVIEVAELPTPRRHRRRATWSLAVPEDSPVSARGHRAGQPHLHRVPERAPSGSSRRSASRSRSTSATAPPRRRSPSMMDALVDLTETGSTLRRNGLQDRRLVLDSTTRLLANKDAWADPEKRERDRGDPHAAARA